MANFRNLVLCAFVFCCLDTRGQGVDWPALEFREVVTNRFEGPVAVTHAGDGSGRLFVGEAKGTVWIVKDGKRLGSPFLDISGRMGTLFGGRGLLSLAFPPGFAGKQYFYALYATETNVVLSRFYVTLNSDVAGARTEEVVLQIPGANASRQGGQLAFGPDGFLYVGVTDLETGIALYPQQVIESGAQDKGSLHGKVLRIDVEVGVKPYGIPAGNPFVNVAGARGEIWALGFQDSWRFSFDRGTGDFYIADNGSLHFQEINFQAAGIGGGQNYGWPLMEGPAVRGQTEPTNWPGLVSPVVWFHSPLPSYYYDVVTGGYVYRGPGAWRMAGVYFYADPKAGSIGAVKKVGGVWKTNLIEVTTGYLDIHAFGEDEAGRLYVAHFFGGALEEVVDSGEVLMPSFSPGYELSANRLKIETATPGAEIHYTLNGAEPTLADPLVPANGEIQVLGGAQNNKVTVRARAFRGDLEPSQIRTMEFLLRTASPEFSPSNGTLTNNMPISLSSSTPGAKIFYAFREGGSLGNWREYTGPFTVSGPAEIAAYAEAPGFEPSSGVLATFWPAMVSGVFIDPYGPGITNGTKVVLSSETVGAVIYYTLDGTPPTRSSAVYAAPLTVNIGTTLKAFAVLPGYADSQVSSVTFVQGITAAPRFTPPGGTETFMGTRSFTLSSDTPGAQIFYTFDLNAGPGQFIPYTGPVAITNDVYVRAYATAPGLQNSVFSLTSFFYPRAEKPWFTPATGPLTNGATIVIESHHPAGTIHYTTNGSMPTASSPVYMGPIVFTGELNLQAAVFENGFKVGDPTQVANGYFGELIRSHMVVTTYVGGAGSTNSGFQDGAFHVARFAEPTGVCVDAGGNLYVADTWNNAVRKVSTNGMVSTIAAPFLIDLPSGIAVDGIGNVYVSELDEHGIFKITPDGTLTRLATLDTHSARDVGNLVYGPDGNLYVGHQGAIWMVTPEGVVSAVSEPFPLSGTFEESWTGLLHVGVDANTNIFAAYGRQIWKKPVGGGASLYAGFGAVYADGARSIAGFTGINGMGVDGAGGIYLTERHVVRQLRGESVTTLAGSVSEYGYRNGRGEEALFINPRGLCVDARGNVYVADSWNNCIRKISPDTAGIGISDEWQLANFGVVGIDPNGDVDGDGVSNYEEFWAGTDPKGNESGLTTEPITFDVSGNLVIRWQTVVGKNYVVEFSEDLVTWEEVGNVVVGNGEVASVIDPNVPDRNAHWFYRVRVVNE